jgi:flagellar basal body-associated protein FliL
MKKFLLFTIFLLGFFCLETQAKQITTTKDVFENGEFLGKSTESGEIILNDYFDPNQIDTGDQTALEGNKGILQIKTIVRTVLGNVNKWLIPIAIIFIVYGGFSLILTRKDEQDIKEQKNQLISVTMGFVIIALSFVLVDSVFFGKTGEILTNGTTTASFATAGFTEVAGIFDLFSTFAIAVAVLFLILNAFKLIVGSDDDQNLNDAKKQVVFSILGIVILFSAKKIVTLITNNGKLQMPDISGTIGFVATWANKILGLIAALAFFAIIWAGLRLIGHFADEGAVENSKKIVIAAVMGMVVAFSAWAIIYYFASASVLG